MSTRPSRKLAKYEKAAAMLQTHDWALMASYMDVLQEVAQIRSEGKVWTEEEIRERIDSQRGQFAEAVQHSAESRAALYGDIEISSTVYTDNVYSSYGDSKPAKPYVIRDGVAIIPLEGVLMPRPGWFQAISGAGSMDIFAQRMAFAAKDDDVKSILIDCDSPGGTVAGVSEAQRAVIDAMAKKPVEVYVRGMCCSGAYWICCAANRIHAPISSVVGSIGVYQMHVDRSKHDEMEGESWSYVTAGARKVDGNPHEPLKGAARQALQDRVDHVYELFLGTVGQHRRLKASDSKALSKATGEGSFFYATTAQQMGLIDSTQHFEQVLKSLASGETTSRQNTFAQASQNSVTQNSGTQDSSVSREPLKDEGLVTAPATREEVQVDKDLKLLLYSLNVTKSQEASDEAARAALDAWAMATGVTLPEGDDKIKAYFVERARSGLTAKPQSASLVDSSASGALDQAAIEAAAETKANRRRKELVASAALLNESGTKVTAEQIEDAIEKKVDPRDAVMSWVSKPRLTGADGRRLDVSVTQDAGDAIAKPVTDAIALIVGGVDDPAKISEQGRYLASQGIDRIAHEVCVAVGKTRLSKEMEAKTFLRLTGGTKDDPLVLHQPVSYADHRAGMVAAIQPAYTPGTLPAVFAAPMRSRIMRSLQTAPVTYQRVAKRDADADDFDGTELKFHSAKGELPERVDGQPRTERAQMSVRPAFWKVKEFGDAIRLTWQTTMSGKLQAFDDLVSDSVWAHERTINRFVVDGVTGDPPMFDGYNLFQTANQTSNNVIVRYINAISGGSGGTVNIAQMTIIDQAMRKQRDFDNKAALGIGPRKLWLPAAHCVSAAQFIKFTEGAQNQAATAPSSMSVWSGLEDIWEPMLDDVDANKWYVFGDPERCPTAMYQFLQGHGPGGVWLMWYDPETDSQVYAIRGVFGVAIVRWQGVFRNSGGV